MLTLVLLAQFWGPSDDVRPFEKDARLVAAHYLIDYEADAGAFVDHPPGWKGFSGRSADWHRTQLAEMRKAGIDVALVRGGAEAVKALAEALDEGPRVAPVAGSFDDARAFYALVPPRHWALLGKRPLVWMAPGSKPPFDAVRAGFKDVGRDPFIVAEEGGDATVAWGAARTGPREFDVVSVGPGFDDGRPKEAVARDGGRRYEKAWYVALRLRPRIIAIETWNNFRDATEVCESREHGRAYLDITAKGADKHHRGEALPRPTGRWSKYDRAVWNLKYEPFEGGLRPVEADDGLFKKVDLAGIDVLTTKENDKGSVRCLYFDVDDSWSFWETRNFAITVEYLDLGQGSFALEYDSADASLARSLRPYKRAGEHAFTGTGEWKFARFELKEALFANRQSGGGDFRLVIDKRGLSVRRVTVRPN